MMLGAGGDEEVGGRHRDAHFAAGTRQLGGRFPNGRRGSNLVEIPFELPEKALLTGAMRPIPQLEQHEITEHRTPLYRRGAYRAANVRITVTAQGVDPGRGIDKDARSHRQASSRMRCSSS